MFTLLCFSPTGNARYLANRLEAELRDSGVTTYALESTRPADIEPSSHLVVVSAIHGFNAPRPVERFMRELPEGRFDRVSLIGVGCADHWVNAAASQRLRRACMQRGCDIALDVLVPMPLTFVTSFPDDMARELVRNADVRAREIAHALRAGEVTERPVPLKSRFVSFLGRAESPAAKLFGLELHASSACDGCARCWTRCPERNISPRSDNTPRFGTNCLMCMRCIYDCPRQAISPRVSKFLPITGGYSLARYLEPRDSIAHEDTADSA